MRYFIHISEFGGEGYRYLPALAFVADDLVVWSPSGYQARAAVETRQSVLGPEDLLALVERRGMRIVGRKRWLLDDESRKKSPWIGARWTETFDGVIKDFAEQDEGLPDAEKRVLFAADEKGQDWAAEEIEQWGSRVELVEELIKAPHALDPEKTRLLPGLAEKLRRLDSHDERLMMALRDIRNHTLAGQEVRADVPVEPLAFREIVADIAAETTDRNPPSKIGPPTEGAWRQLVALAEEVRSPESLRDVEELLDLKERPGVRELIHGLLLHGDPRSQVEAELEGAAELETWWQTILSGGDFPLANAFDTVGALLGAFLEPAAMAVPLTRLGYSLGLASDRFRNREEEEKAAIPYVGSQLPFLLAFGDATATFERIGELKRRLRSSEKVELPF